MQTLGEEEGGEMNRRNLFKYFGAAAALVAVPALARGPRFRVLYSEGPSPFTIDGRLRKYDMAVRFSDGSTHFFGVDVEKRDDVYGRDFLERRIRAGEEVSGFAVDASELMQDHYHETWV
jgi:hypothetical protein